MTLQSPSQILRDSARGGRTYIASRHRFAQAILAHPNETLEPLNQFLTEKLFKIKKDEWYVLGFDSKDWPSLDRLAQSTVHQTDTNYESLVGDYIAANADRVNAMYRVEAQISSAVLKDDGDSVAGIFDSFDVADRQSMFAFRTFSAQRSHSNEILLEYFRKQMTTSWLRKRFIYPFVYYSINNTSDLYIDTFLSYILAGNIEHFSEKDTIRFLLCDEIAVRHSASFKYYIALLCHPFDACEIFLNHIELEFVQHGTIPAHSSELLEKLVKLIPQPHVKAIYQLVTRAPLAFNLHPTGDNISQLFDLNGVTKEFLIRFTDITCDSELDNSALTRVFSALARMRSSKYPIPDDFTVLVTAAFKWRFTDAGRLLSALLSSIFMVSRREVDYEARMLTRLLNFLGAYSPFILTTPSGPWALERGILPPPIGKSFSEIESLTEQNLKPPNSYSSRLWIKAVHWILRKPEKQRHIANWLAIVRENIRVSPAFLTGINWKWVSDIIQVMRLAPFRGRESGAYALLLMQIEQGNRDATALRIAIEPFAKDKSFRDFVSWLIQEYKAEAVAFARFFLTPDNILMLRLAPNFTAALSQRIYALEACIREFNFGPLVDEARFRQEAKVLTTTLLLTNINAGQFEVPWDIFRNDISEKEEDTYDAYLSFTGTANALPILGNARLATPHRFRNGKVVTYEFENSYWPIVILLLRIIDGFIQHPSFGIEVLLSTRFRHDTMHREYAAVLTRAKDTDIPTVPLAVQRPIIDEIGVELQATITDWLIRRMQTQRPGRPDALFDVTPSQEELRTLAVECLKLESLDAIIMRVCDWMQDRLKPQIADAHKSLVEELGPRLQQKIEETKERIISRNIYRPTDVTRTAALIVTVTASRTQDLTNWFRTGDATDRPSLTFEEMKLAVDGVFETQISRGLLRSHLKRGVEADTTFPPEKVRLCFDLISELYANAIKFGRAGKARVKIWPYAYDGFSGFVFSTPTLPKEDHTESIAGERYESLTDAIFREGNSGLPKIAALAASIARQRVNVTVRQTTNAFHVFVPILGTHSVNASNVSVANAK